MDLARQTGSAAVNLAAAEELKRAHAAAAEASRFKSEFLATVSHEIRTPLNAVIGMAGLLLDTELKPDQHEYASAIRQAGDRLLEIVNDILDFAKIEVHNMELESVDFDLRVVVDEGLETLAKVAQRKELELTYLFDEQVPVALRGDPGRLQQLLINLVGNAIKFTREGEVAVHVQVEEQTGRDALLRVGVRDTGVGIKAEQYGRLFQAFTQADGSTTRRHGGMGLGLVISKELAELMGGEMGVESEPEKGSTFWFTARLRKQSSDVDESSRPSLTSVTGRVEDEVDPSEHRILVAEDNANNQMLVLRQLEKLGYRADVAVNGLEVLEALARTRYTLVFMDCQMPEMNGFRAAAEYRKREDAKLHLPIIAMSAGSIEDNREKWLGAGMDDYLLKPVSLEKLAAIISHWLPAADASLDSLDTSLLEEMVDSFGGDVEFLAEMIQAYQDSIPESLDVLRKALQGQDANTVRIVAHGLKSSSGQFGARRMAFLFMNLEKLGKIAQLAEAGDLIRALESEFARVRVELQEAAVRLSAAAKA